MQKFLILLLVGLATCEDANSNECGQDFTDCFKGFNEGIDFTNSDSFNSQTGLIFAASNDTWSKECGKVNELKKCVEKTNCISEIKTYYSGIFDMIKYGCSVEGLSVIKNYRDKCLKDNTFLQSFVNCVSSSPKKATDYTCEKYKTEFKCVNDAVVANGCITSDQYYNIINLLLGPHVDKFADRSCEPIPA